MRSRPEGYLALLDELIERDAEIVDRIEVAIRRAAPKAYRDFAVADSAEHLRHLLPICLRCMRDGGSLSAADLQPMLDASRRRANIGIPVVVALNGIAASMGSFGTLVVRQAGVHRAGAAALVLAQAAMFSHEFAQAAAGVYAASSDRPDWADTLPLVARRILHLAALGYSTKQIASSLHYSEQAVSYHLGQLMRKMGVKNRAALAALAVHYDLVDLSSDPPGSDGSGLTA